MKLSKSRIAALAALGLAVLALAADRLWIGSGETSPRPAAASSAPVATALAPAAPTGSAPAAGNVSAATGRASVADRLKQLAAGKNLDADGVKEAFAPAESWMVQVAAPPAVAEEAAPKPSDPVESFADTHKLTSVLISGSGGIAMVNGKMLRMGQEIEGYRLVGLAPGSATFRSGSGTEVQLFVVTDRRKEGL
jgi:hypothetical protein